MYKVSIVLPVYRVEKYIEQCARSLFEQTFVDLQLIFVDNASTDNSIEILKRTLEEYPQCRDHTLIVRKPINEGGSRGREYGMQYVKGDYVMHLDSDDWVDPQMVENLYAKALETNADIVYADRFIYTDHDELSCVKDYSTPLEYQKASFYLQAPAMTWNKLYKTSLFTENNIYFPKDTLHEDLCINAQIFYYAKSIAHLPEAYYHYRVNPNSVTRNYRISNAMNDVDYLRSFIFDNNIDEYKLPYYGFVNYVKSFYIKKKGLWTFANTRRLFTLSPESCKYAYSYSPILKWYDRFVLRIISFFIR